MKSKEDMWEERLSALWQTLDDFTPGDFIERLDRFLAELPPQSPVALFERASAHDSTGRPDLAIPLYQSALDAGLSGIRRRRATIQMSSSLRNLGNAERATALLTAELNAPSDELDGAVRAFLALALADLGRDREALAISLTALSRYLPRYNRSLARYASELVDPLEESPAKELK